MAGELQVDPGPVRLPTSPRQQEALRRLHAQASQRIELGKRLFDAADRRLSAVQQFRAEQEALRQELTGDAVRREEALSRRLDELDGRLTAMQREWSQMHDRVGQMLDRTETLLEHTLHLLGDRGIDTT